MKNLAIKWARFLDERSPETSLWWYVPISIAIIVWGIYNLITNKESIDIMILLFAVGMVLFGFERHGLKEQIKELKAKNSDATKR